MVTIWKDRSGKPVETKEFFSRWKQGIRSVSPLTQTKFSLFGNILIIIGISLGIGFSFKNHQTWLLILLLGSLIITSFSLISILQRLLILLEVEKLNKAFIESKGGSELHE